MLIRYEVVDPKKMESKEKKNIYIIFFNNDWINFDAITFKMTNDNSCSATAV